jgi:hypothetical protein
MVHMHEINNLPTQKKYVLTVCMILINNRWISRQRRYIKLQGMHMNTAYILTQCSTFTLRAVFLLQNWWQKNAPNLAIPMTNIKCSIFFNSTFWYDQNCKSFKNQEQSHVHCSCLIITAQKIARSEIHKKGL